MNCVQSESIFSFFVDQEDSQVRLDQFISQKFPQYSRSFLSKIIQQNCIHINDKLVDKKSRIVQAGDIISIIFPSKQVIADTHVDISALSVQVLYTHDHFLILNKPAGLLVHASSKSSTEITLVDWISAHYQEIDSVGSVDRPGIVHRLDKDTSGIIIVPRTNYAHTIFGDLFKNREIQKTYHALVHGCPDKEGSIDLPIGRDPIYKIKMKTFSQLDQQYLVNKKIRSSQTNYSVISYFDEISYLKVKPVTGRTHQIRVHFAAIKHPLVGDSVYGMTSKLIKRHALHAYDISFIFENQEFSFSCEIPNDFKYVLDILQKKSSI